MNKNCSQTEGAKLGCKLEKGRRHMAFNLNNNMMNMCLGMCMCTFTDKFIKHDLAEGGCV